MTYPSFVCPLRSKSGLHSVPSRDKIDQSIEWMNGQTPKELMDIWYNEWTDTQRIDGYMV